MSDPYNPLSKLNLARSIESEVLARDLLRLDQIGRFRGAGIYAIYYAGDLEFYRPLRDTLSSDNPRPIYVGKAIPPGGRTGGMRADTAPTNALSSRLAKQARSIAAAQDLNVAEFLARYLVVDDIWIPLGENTLIETYQPLWNKVIAGFGNNPLGSGREAQRISLWDILHPGRVSNVDESRQAATRAELVERVRAFLRGEPVLEVDLQVSEAEDDSGEDSLAGN